MATEERCVEAKKEANSMHEENDLSNRHMTWWRDALCVRMDNGPHLRTARDSRRVWRAATRAAREARVTERVAEGEREKWEQGTTGRKRKQHLTRCLSLSNHSNNSQNTSSSSSNNGRGDAASVTSTTGALQVKELPTKNELLFPSST